jgi:predicted house-cleaning noncanonical NTP pyrophosphatase (MazG superfamily)
MRSRRWSTVGNFTAVAQIERQPDSRRLTPFAGAIVRRLAGWQRFAYQPGMASRRLRFRIGKLIRDRMIDAMHRQGLETFERVMEEQEFKTRLLDKLVEEASEVRGAKKRAELIEELADVHEVLLAIEAIYDLDREQIEHHRRNKHAQYGGFDGRIYNEAVEVNEDNTAASYYLARPDKYPSS